MSHQINPAQILYPRSGPPGPRGCVGPIGPRGYIGTEGAQGPEGAQGAQGAQGPEGAQGAQGDVGAQGPIGPDGMVTVIQVESGTRSTDLIPTSLGHPSVDGKDMMVNMYMSNNTALAAGIATLSVSVNDIFGINTTHNVLVLNLTTNDWVEHTMVVPQSASFQLQFAIAVTSAVGTPSFNYQCSSYEL